jgi:hypothetical protein
VSYNFKNLFYLSQFKNVCLDSFNFVKISPDFFLPLKYEKFYAKGDYIYICIEVRFDIFGERGEKFEQF